MEKPSTLSQQTRSKLFKGVIAAGLVMLSCVYAKANTPVPSEWPMMSETAMNDSINTESKNIAANQSAVRISVSASGRLLKISGVDDGTKVEVFSLLGNKVHTAYVSNGELNLPQLNKGIYIVRIEKYCQKIIL